jgi:hypothetical protein
LNLNFRVFKFAVSVETGGIAVSFFTDKTIKIMLSIEALIIKVVHKLKIKQDEAHIR